MTDRLLTIIIPVYNRRELIIRTLNSVAAQEGCREVELIVVDNGSTDGSKAAVTDWLLNHGEISGRILDEPKSGATAARNRGLRDATTPWVMFFDSDDVMLDGLLQGITDAISAHPETDLIGWDILKQMPGSGFRKMSFLSRDPMKAHLVHAILATQRFAARRDLFEAAGGWDEDVRGWNDYELGVRLLCLRPRITALEPGKEKVVTYFTENSITGRKFASDPEKWELALRRVEETLKKNAPQYRHWIDYRRAALAADYAREGDMENSRRLLAEARSKGHPIAAQIIYLHHRMLHRGAHYLWRLMSGIAF